MKNIKNKYLLIPLFVFIGLSVLFSSINYIENEGFNPTDEGVILSQSWRIINGEIAHTDFISIRPVASAYLHSLNFVIPGSVVENARIFVLFQYFIIALVMSIMCFRTLERINKKKYHFTYFFALLIAGLTVTILNYNLYSWTTIDAVFWSVIALPLIFSKNKWKIAVGLLLTSLAALSRQTFAVITLSGFLYVVYQNRREFVKFIPVFIIGALPFLAYFIMLMSSNGLSEFISQMTGRTEFFQTAILQFAKKFILGMTSALNTACLFICALLYFKRKSAFRKMFITKGYHSLISIIYLFFTIVITVRHFILPEVDIYSLPFDLFFMTVFFTVFHYLLNPDNLALRKISVASLIIAWTSSISLGDNSPVFAAGILLISLTIMCFDVILSYPSTLTKPITNKYLLITLSIIIFGFGLYSQPRVNYRDTASDEYVTGLGLASEEFGDIRTNRHVVAYYNELSDIFYGLDNAINNTVVFPNNAMFYTAMKTRNPAPVDWLSPYEYIGQESRIIRDLNNVIKTQKTYFIVDKIDIRVIKNGIKPLNYSKDIVFDFIIANCDISEIDSDFFTVYISKAL
ncbi:MAG: hypothetical protein PHP52_05835 [Bacteroidales bacterium]|nr:hypothetical protein [Bacteroidales bacterium]MDD4215907.1 hypothetical protein [Bacteroidales bacterium]MDY0141166.1 hypothetical protein [Bacteroidales bacterium]